MPLRLNLTQAGLRGTEDGPPPAPIPPVQALLVTDQGERLATELGELLLAETDHVQ